VIAVMFDVHPWQMLQMPPYHRAWYEKVAERQLERDHEIRQDFLEAIAKIFGG
jgi:hypothetical protein